MIILIVLGVLVIVGIVFGRMSRWNSGLEMVGSFIALVGGVFLVVGLIAIPLRRMDTLDGIQKVEAVRSTVEQARADGIYLESAAIQTKVAESNEWIASQKYWRGTVFGLWVHPDIETVEPIR